MVLVEPVLIRSASAKAGTLWPNVPPPGAGVEVWPETASAAVEEETRIAP